MSRNGRQSRETITPEEVTPIDHYEADYNSRCMVCDATPTVLGVSTTGSVVYAAGLCGPCTWGSAECIDPRNW